MAIKIYTVLKPFGSEGLFGRPGQGIELDDADAVTRGLLDAEFIRPGGPATGGGGGGGDTSALESRITGLDLFAGTLTAFENPDDIVGAAVSPAGPNNNGSNPPSIHVEVL